MTLRILSGGAAHALVSRLAPLFKTRTGHDVEGTFGAVGAMRDKLLAGEPADLLILTSALIGELVRTGHVLADSVADVGGVRTGVAVRQRDAFPRVTSAGDLRRLLQSASEIFVPDTALSTAGIHVRTVLDGLQIASEVASRLRQFPNGATAMKALAAATSPSPIGITQRTEILGTPGVAYVAALPDEHALATVYTAAISTRANLPREAGTLIALLTGAEGESARAAAGFEPTE
jgi:molybdate transport system substrate-binding protein